MIIDYTLIFYTSYRIEAVNRQTEIQIHFHLHHLNLKFEPSEKKETSFCNKLFICKNHSLCIRYFSYNYALKSALLPHPNNQRPDKTECNQLLRQWPECFYKLVSLIHTQYTSILKVSTQQCWVRLKTTAHCRE